jgi:prepilin-type N-terminal cleavage/methylation domain-containing protein
MGDSTRFRRGSHQGRRKSAFTLIEVLVVVAIIALLIAILLPSLAKARELARRTVCSTRLHNMGVSVHSYSQANKGKIIQCRSGTYTSPVDPSVTYGPIVQVAIDPRLIAPASATSSTPGSQLVDWWAAGKKYQLDRDLWECPNREGTFLYEGSPTLAEQGYDAATLRSKGYRVADNGADYDQWIIGYQYLGGIRQWDNLYGRFKSASPLDANAKPSWALAADSVLKVDTYWGGGRDAAFGKMPPHVDAGGRPAGGNVLTFDGAATWIVFPKMKFIHSWAVTTRECYWWQADMGDFGLFLAKRKAQGL